MAYLQVFMIALLSCLLLAPEGDAATTYDIRGNIPHNQDVKIPHDACCYVPTCVSPNQCYRTLSCGYMCHKGNFPPATSGPTPGYSLKNSFTKYGCRFNDCRNYEYTCTHCPDPKDPEFSVHSVRQDCRDCYYLKEH